MLRGHGEPRWLGHPLGGFCLCETICAAFSYLIVYPEDNNPAITRWKEIAHDDRPPA
jgi:hypothetical protein